MNDEPNQHDGERMQKPPSVRFITFVSVTFAGHAVGMAMFVGSAGLILGIPAHSLLVPYAALLGCGLIFSPLLYWARLSRGRPKSRALRFGIAMFLYMPTFTLVVGFGTVRLHILPQAEALSVFGLLVLPAFAFTAAAAYGTMSRMLKT